MEFSEKELRRYTKDFDDRQSIPPKGSLEYEILEHNAIVKTKELLGKPLSNRAKSKLSGNLKTMLCSNESENSDGPERYDIPHKIRKIINFYLPDFRVLYLIYLYGETELKLKEIISDNFLFERVIENIKHFKKWYKTNESDLLFKAYQLSAIDGLNYVRV